MVYHNGYIQSEKRLSKISLFLFLIFTLFQTFPTVVLLAHENEVFGTFNVNDEVVAPTDTTKQRNATLIGLSLLAAIIGLGGAAWWWGKSGGGQSLLHTQRSNNSSQPIPQGGLPRTTPSKTEGSKAKDSKVKDPKKERHAAADQFIKSLESFKLKDKKSAELEELLSSREDKEAFKLLIKKAKGFVSDSNPLEPDANIIANELTMEEIEKLNELLGFMVDEKLRRATKEANKKDELEEKAKTLAQWIRSKSQQKEDVLNLFSNQADKNRYAELLKKATGEGSVSNIQGDDIFTKLTPEEINELDQLKDKSSAPTPEEQEKLARRKSAEQFIESDACKKLGTWDGAALETLLLGEEKKTFKALVNKAGRTFEFSPGRCFFSLNSREVEKLEPADFEELVQLVNTMTTRAAEKEKIAEKIFEKRIAAEWWGLEKEKVVKLFSFRSDKDTTDVGRFEELFEKTKSEGTCVKFEKFKIAKKLTMKEANELDQLTDKLSAISAQRMVDRSERTAGANEIIEAIKNGPNYEAIKKMSGITLEGLLSTEKDKQIFKQMIEKMSFSLSDSDCLIRIGTKDLEESLTMAEIKEFDELIKAMAQNNKNQKQEFFKKIGALFVNPVMALLQAKTAKEVIELLENDEQKQEFRRLLQKLGIGEDSPFTPTGDNVASKLDRLSDVNSFASLIDIISKALPGAK